MVQLCTAVTTLDTTNADQTDPSLAREPACQITGGPSTCRGGTVNSCLSQSISPIIKHASWVRIRYCVHACCAVTVRFWLGFAIQTPSSLFGVPVYNGWRSWDTVSINSTDGFTSGSVKRNLCLGDGGGLDGSFTDIDAWMIHVSSASGCEDDNVVKIKFCLEWVCDCGDSTGAQSWTPPADAICGSVTVT